MSSELKALIEHDLSDDCGVCRAQEIVDMALLPAAAAWEQTNQLPRLSVALHGAAGLLGAMLEEGVPRADVETALATLLDDIEDRIADDTTFGGPTQGNA